MIDLNKSQLVLEDVKVRVWNGCRNGFLYERYLQCIDHSLKKPFVCFGNRYKREESINLCAWEHAELIQPRYKVKKFYDLVAVLKEQGYLPEKDRPNYLSSDNYKIYFLISMFECCGENSDGNNYIWHSDWLEEVKEE